MGESQKIYQQRSVSQQQQDFCGLVREKGIIVEMLLVVLSVEFKHSSTELTCYSSMVCWTGRNSFWTTTMQEPVSTLHIVAVTST